MPSETAKTYLERLLSSALFALQLAPPYAMPEISKPDERFGDYATNVALILGKALKENPQVLAEKLLQQLKAQDTAGVFSEISAAAGFINFRLSNQALLKNLDDIHQHNHQHKEKYGASQAGQGQTVVFEYSSPNTNKPLHIGHTRNDTYGMACINLLKSQGYKVVACEIINDRGIHIMKSVLMYMKFGEGKTPEFESMKPDHFVGKFYQMFAQEAAKSEAAEKQLLEEAQTLLQKWEAGDEELRKVWKQMNDWFFVGVKETYQREGSHFDEVTYESDIYDKGRELVLQGVKKGIFAKEPDGSVVVDLTNEGLDKKYLLRKDGTTLYITQDMYLWHLRDERHHPELALVTTSAEQTYHFRALSKIFEKLNFPWAKNFKHLPYEHVFLGKSKMSSREGNAITADELVESVKAQIREVMKNSDRVKASVNDDKLVEAIAFGAIKYGYLKYEPNTRIYFDLDSTISVEGNTGPYIQYAHARIMNILKKAGEFKGLSSALKTFQPAELELVRKLLHFGEIIEQAAKDYKPNLLCNYLYELASLFNRFYQEAPVLQEPNDELRSFRLQLITATAQVLKNGLNLLGIEAPEEM